MSIGNGSAKDVPLDDNDDGHDTAGEQMKCSA